jgi:type VII secretion-associated serine protease mycosin
VAAVLAALASAALLLAAPAAGAFAATPTPAPTAAQQCTAGQVSWVAQSPPAFRWMQTDLAWSITQGAGVLVAVVDSGVDATNDHLASALSGGVDLVGDGAGANGYADLSGHGTVVAGIIAARAVTGSGVLGVAPAARVLSVRVYAAETDAALKAGYGPSPARVAAGIRYAADAGAKVISVSLSTATDEPDLRAAVAHAAERGALVVASAGNRTTAQDTSDGPRYPAADPGALAVTAVGADGAPTDASVHGPHVLLAAPGAQVLSSANGSGDCLFATDSAESSFATAYAAGAAALVAAAHPDESPAQWAYRLMATAVRDDPDRRDDQVGWGIAQPYDAITLTPGADVRGPANPFTGTTPTPVALPAEHVRLSAVVSPWSTARGVAAISGVLAATAIGVLAPVALLHRRRRDEARPATPLTGTGLYGTVDPPTD